MSIKEVLFNLFLKGRLQTMLTKLWGGLEGSKTYALAVLGILVALIGHFWGPVDIAGQTIPKMDWSQVWQVVWASGLFSALHAKK